MEFDQESRLCMPMCRRVVNCDICEDFTLPDYCPEIRRVLYVKEDIPTPARFISGSKIDVNGVVDYTLVYINGEGDICSAPLCAEYSFTLPMDNVSEFDLGEGVTVMAHTFADSSGVRVSAPRKLQLRSRLHSNVSAYGKMICEEELSGLENSNSVQRLYGETTCADMLCESTDVVTLSDEYILPSEDCRVALADGRVALDDARIDGELIRIKGEVLIRMLISCSGRSETVMRKLPFDAETDLDGVAFDGDSSLRVGGCVTELTLNVEEGRVAIEANAVLEVCLSQNRTVAYTRDMYSTEQLCEISSKTYALPQMIENKNTGFSQNDVFETSELNIPEGAQIVHIYGRALCEDIAFDDGKYVASGSSRYDLICIHEGEYMHAEARAPFRYELSGDKELCSFDMAVNVMNCKARLDGDKLYVDSDMAAELTLMGKSDCEIISSVDFGEAREGRQGCLNICYVTPEDSTWSICKRYGVTEKDIKGDPATDRYVMIE